MLSLAFEPEFQAKFLTLNSSQNWTSEKILNMIKYIWSDLFQSNEDSLFHWSVKCTKYCLKPLNGGGLLATRKNEWVGGAALLPSALCGSNSNSRQFAFV